MSNFFADFRNKHTGEVVSVYCCDDYFGKHEYGFMVQGTNVFLRQDTFDKNFERVERESS